MHNYDYDCFLSLRDSFIQWIHPCCLLILKMKWFTVLHSVFHLMTQVDTNHSIFLDIQKVTKIEWHLRHQMKSIHCLLLKIVLILYHILSYLISTSKCKFHLVGCSVCIGSSLITLITDTPQERTQCTSEIRHFGTLEKIDFFLQKEIHFF